MTLQERMEEAIYSVDNDDISRAHSSAITSASFACAEIAEQETAALRERVKVLEEVLRSVGSHIEYLTGTNTTVIGNRINQALNSPRSDAQNL